MPRGLVAWELFLLLADFPPDQEVTANGAPIDGIDLSFGRSDLICEPEEETEAQDACDAVRELADEFEKEWFGDKAAPIAPHPIVDSVKKLIERIFEQLPEEDG